MFVVLLDQTLVGFAQSAGTGSGGQTDALESQKHKKNVWEKVTGKHLKNMSCSHESTVGQS